MTILKTTIVGMFRGHKTNGEAADLVAAAEAEADFAIDTYMDAFEARAALRLEERKRRWIGYAQDESVDADFTTDDGEHQEVKQPKAAARITGGQPTKTRRAGKR